jgi:hypothetical protein
MTIWQKSPLRAERCVTRPVDRIAIIAGVRNQAGRVPTQWMEHGVMVLELCLIRWMKTNFIVFSILQPREVHKYRVKLLHQNGSFAP